MAPLESLRRSSFVGEPGEKIMTSYSIFKSPVGDLMLVANQSELIGIYFLNCRHVPKAQKTWALDERHPVLQQAEKQLKEYFAGKRNSFSLPMNFAGTDFQKRVWQEIARIPFGKNLTYSELAKKAGAPNAIRAAGTATGRNPLSIVVPCHRVLTKDGAIGGYAGGLEKKRHLLKLEGILLSKDG
jgi:methylated-DNA-[protein]-cysteine S-methyltransferase